MWIRYANRNCWWQGHGSDEVDSPRGTAVPRVHSLDACLTSCLQVPAYYCDAVLFNSDEQGCYRKRNIKLESCSHDWNFDLYVRGDTDYRPPMAPPLPPVGPSPPRGPPPPMWQTYENFNCWWGGNGADEVDYPQGSHVAGVTTVASCLASCIDVDDWFCEGVLWNRNQKNCYRKTNLTLSECHHDPAFDLHYRTDLRFLNSPPPPYSSELSPATCDALLSDPGGMLKQMWNRVGWRQLGEDEPCWGWDSDADEFFDNVLSGGSCQSNWYEGSIGWQRFHSDAPGVLGFDDAIGNYCGGLPWRRRLDSSNESEAVGRWIEEGRGEHERSHRRRLADSARMCVDRSRNILMLFGDDVHDTGSGYNSCRNLEWQVCSAMGLLPGQNSATVIFAQAPSTLNAEGKRPLGHCGGYSPQGCGSHAYSNDDIFFLEVCMFSKICANNWVSVCAMPSPVMCTRCTGHDADTQHQLSLARAHRNSSKSAPGSGSTARSRSADFASSKLIFELQLPGSSGGRVLHMMVDLHPCASFGNSGLLTR